MDYIVMVDPELGCKMISEEAESWPRILEYIHQTYADFVPYNTERVWGKAFDIIGENARIRATMHKPTPEEDDFYE